MFEGEKTFVFWIGLIILGLASVGLFAMIWYDLVMPYYFISLEYEVPLIVGAVVFVFIGLYMMKSGAVKGKR